MGSGSGAGVSGGAIGSIVSGVSGGCVAISNSFFLYLRNDQSSGFAISLARRNPNAVFHRAARIDDAGSIRTEPRHDLRIFFVYLAKLDMLYASSSPFLPHLQFAGVCHSSA